MPEVGHHVHYLRSLSFYFLIALLSFSAQASPAAPSSGTFSDGIEQQRDLASDDDWDVPLEFVHHKDAGTPPFEIESLDNRLAYNSSANPVRSSSSENDTSSSSATGQDSKDDACEPTDSSTKSGSDCSTTKTSKSATTKKAATPPAYKLLRYDEDYSYLKDSSLCTDLWDPIKYIPLCECNDSYLSIGGEIRERYEFVHNPLAGSGTANAEGNNQDFTERYLLHGDLHINPNFRLFGQLVSGFETGRIGGPRPDIDENTFDWHQGFADFVLPLADEKDTLTARIGRQEFEYGSGRLIDVRDGVNLRLSFDAARILLHEGDWEIDGWWSKPVLNNPGVFDDEPDPERSFWGVYSVHPVDYLPKGNVDLYYLGFQNEDATYVQGTGPELRNTLGTRIWGRPLPWEYNFEYDWQFGEFDSGTIEAWSAAHAIRYNFSDLLWKPRPGIRFDFTSGDNNPNSASLQTFNPLFPSGQYFNLLNPVGPQNMIDLHPTIDLYPADDVTLSLDWDFFWRESLGDGVYQISGQPLRTGVDGPRYIGNSPAAVLVWNPTRHLSVLTSYVHFFPGGYFEANPPDKETDYVTVWLDYKL